MFFLLYNTYNDYYYHILVLRYHIIIIYIFMRDIYNIQDSIVCNLVNYNINFIIISFRAQTETGTILRTHTTGSL